MLRIPASGLQARNIGQIVTTRIDGDTLMGKLERVEFKAGGTVRLRVSSMTVEVPENHEVDMRRSSELGEAYRLRQDIGDVLDELDDVAAGVAV